MMKDSMRKIFVLLLTVCLLITLSSIAYAAGFSDTEKHWAVKEINSWASKGLVSGYSDGTFRPNQQVSRAEFVAMANRAFNIKSSNASVNFTDVSPEKWFYNDIVSANAAGYIGGYSDGTFRPNRTITRLEAACVIARLLNLKPNPEGITSFKDSTSVAAWARSNIGAVVDSGLMRGFPDGSFLPDKSITRAEAVVSLSRAYSQGKDEKPKVIEEEIDSGSPGNHNVGTLDAQEGTTSFTGGGGGGSTTPSGETPVVHSVTFKVDRDAGAANVTVEGEDNLFDINLTGYEMTDRFTGLSVNASDNAQKAWVTVSGITRELKFNDGTASTTVKEILGPLDTGDPGVSLQRLMEFGINTISVTVESNDGTRTEVTVTVEFPSD